MEAVLKRLQTLTSDQLRDQIISAGLRCGPVTATTRSIFEKKLARALLEGSDVAVVHSGSPDPVEEPISETENGEETNHDAQTPTESPSVYYGVCPQLDDPSVEDGPPLVYTEKTKALKAVMKLKGARFKAFATREDAENFAKGVCDGGMSPHTPSPEKPGAGSVTEWLMNADPANMEKANEFRSPRTQDLTAKLRRAVERGDEDTFRELVWGNPRYLIGSGDNPTIVQEGCRYNVLHVAAKENQAGIARLVLETLEDPEFMRLMYPHDQELMLWQRIRYIVDLYLNTPDKASNETPLHFACKFGCPEVVDVLCSHPSVDKHCRNKYDLDPSSMICERKNRSKEVKQKIREYLEDRFYVPLLRAADNTLPPEISVPWCPGSPESCDRFYRPDRMTDSPKHPVKVIKAFVGPLNASKAQEFHRLWRTPPRDRAGYFHHILKSDSQRGAERVGRELAREMGHPWAEHWDFLQCFIDLSSRDGLQMLDEHLRSTEARLTPDPDEHLRSTEARLTPDPDEHLRSTEARLTPDPDEHLRSTEARLTPDPDEHLRSTEARLTPDPDEHLRSTEARLTPDPDEHLRSTEARLTPDPDEHLRSTEARLTPDPDEHLRSTEARLTPDPDEHLRSTEARLTPDPDEHLRSTEARLTPDPDEHLRSTEARLTPDPDEHLTSTEARLTPDPDEHLRSTEARLTRTRLTPDPDEDPGSSRRFPVCDLMQEFEKVLLSADHMIRSDEVDEGSSISSEEYFTADEDDDDDRESSSDSGSSFKSTRSSAERDSVDRRRPDVYILGDSPSKLDCEVLLALSGVDIDPLVLPSVTRWRDRVTAHSASETQSWPSASPSRAAESRSPSVLTRVTVSPKLRPAGHFMHPGQFMFSPPSRAYTRL